MPGTPEQKRDREFVGNSLKNVGKMLILSTKCQQLPYILPIPTDNQHKIYKFAIKYQLLNVSSSLFPLNINVFPTSTFPPQFLNSKSAEVAKTNTIICPLNINKSPTSTFSP